MTLAKNITTLRKRAGWSQEALAHQIDVSRQAVSKWESGQSTPDLDKVVKLAEVFNVSTDALLKDLDFQTDAPSHHSKVESPPAPDNAITPEQAQQYVKLKTEAAGLIARGVAFCVVSPSVMFLLFAMAASQIMGVSNNTGVGVGVVVLLLFVARGIAYFIKANQLESALPSNMLKPFTITQEIETAIRTRQQDYAPTFQQHLIKGIGLFVLCAAPLMIAAGFGWGGSAVMLMLIVLLAMISLGLFYVIPASVHNEALKFVLQGGDKDAGKSEETKHTERLAGVYWPLLVAIYLGWSFWTMDWGITWIIFPVGAVAFGGIVGIKKLRQQ